MDSSEKNFEEILKERFDELPSVVQQAITHANVDGRLQELSASHKLHVDQWDKLQLEVRLALLGFQDVENLSENIANNVGIEGKEAEALAADVSRIVFEPIRLELERGLGHPEAKSEMETMDPVAQVRAQVLSNAPLQRPLAEVLPSSGEEAPAPMMTMPTAEEVAAAVPNPAPSPTLTISVAPATPPVPAPDTTVERAPASTSYANTASHERKDVAGDPYREQV